VVGRFDTTISMKRIAFFASRLTGLTAGLLIVVLASQDTAGASSQGVAKIIRVTGLARYSTDNLSWQTVKVGDILKPGSLIQTSDHAVVDVRLGEREAKGAQPIPNEIRLYVPEEPAANEVRIFANSVLGIDRLTVGQTGLDSMEETQLDLRAGRIMGHVKKLASVSLYEVKFPTGVMGVRGTIYMLASSGLVSVLAGSVLLSYALPDTTLATKVVPRGHQFDPSTGGLIEISTPEGPWSPKEPGVPVTPPVPYTHDHTIIYISPIHGEQD
jgi:hypothetical protein